MLNHLPTAGMLADLLCHVFATLPCLKVSEWFDGLVIFGSFLSARMLGSQRGVVLEILFCAACRTVRVSRFFHGDSICIYYELR
jgi:hypothetical protein